MTSFQLIRPTTAEDDLEKQEEQVTLAPISRNGSSPYGPYIVDDDLATVTNVAITLGQPLLLTGEPGSGKTAFAWAVARQLGAAEVLEFQTKSTSVARDLFYSFDTLRRFHDANVGHEDARKPENYISYQALGVAIRSKHTRVVLVDEIDKAPRDFPNDLLRELDRMEFSVPELSPPLTCQASARHMVVITSNEERRLPLPFLRRCVHHHIRFPDADLLQRIVSAHLGQECPGEGFIELVVRRFQELREIPGLSKLPSTGELLGWVRVLLAMEVPEDRLESAAARDLPALQVLVKQREDQLLVNKGS